MKLKTLFFITAVMAGSSSFAQAFKAKGDQKFQVGINVQENGTGINATYDYGLGSNISLGLASSYLLNVEDYIDADFIDRIDVKGRFNAHLGDVIGLPPAMDIYPGLNLSFKNFGGHTGVRYFFTEGFGLYSEISFPIAYYDTGNLSPAEELHNQFVFTGGVSFNF
ncbi:DUF6646 family protein [Mangrovimonas aestuarii]|uniref:DUF6646 family protein n=1 Tax=Mangrovimonas aestuarii TaxID=3018443 RepID=UPI0023791A4B|nr:DUF6646 family protein [Mangrovimonas aestuarii]